MNRFVMLVLILSCLQATIDFADNVIHHGLTSTRSTLDLYAVAVPVRY